MSFSYGEALKITLFGQSHAETVGVVIDGLPAGEKLELEKIRAFMARRAPGGRLSTQRREEDLPEIISGVVNGFSCGAPITAIIRNNDIRSADYAAFSEIPRPSHADFAAIMKHGEYHDIRGGGYFSARLTAALCFAGAVALGSLERRGIYVGAHLLSVGSAANLPFDAVGLKKETFSAIKEHSLPVIDEKTIANIEAEIESARAGGDSIGAVVECAAIGLSAGLGSPVFGGVENRISSAVFAIPAVRGIEFGAGFAAAGMRGSEHNDAFVVQNGTVRTKTNRHGGVLGGLTSGMPLLFSVAFKPTPSIAIEQESVDTKRGENAKLVIGGRHDPCVALRAVPCVEAAAAIALLDMHLQEGK